MNLRIICLSISFLGLMHGYGVSQQAVKKSRGNQYNDAIAHGVLGTYSAPPRLPDGKVDNERLIAELTDIHATTYNWLIWRNEGNDLSALKQFLPMARKAGIQVWVTLVPPSEPPPSEPFRMDYDQWAAELAVLSKQETNLVAWSIDDFVHNLRFFSPEYVKEFVSRAHAINPKLAFVPCCYFRQTTQSFVDNYASFFDGVLFPYRAESAGANLKDPTLVAAEIARLRSMYPQGLPIILDVYASPHSRLGATTPAYVREVVNAGIKHADGVLIFCHQDPVKDAEKYKIIKEAFGKASSTEN